MDNLRERTRQMSRRARLLTALVLAAVLLGISALCAFTTVLMMGFSTDACARVPAAADAWLFVPPALLLVGALLPPLLFLLRRNLYWVAGAFFGAYALSAITFIGWFVFVVGAC